MPLNIIFPSGYQVEVSYLRQQLDCAHFAFWMTWKQNEPTFVIENVRFRHDPNWRGRFWGIQSAHDGNHIVWKATRIVLGMMGQLI